MHEAPHKAPEPSRVDDTLAPERTHPDCQEREEQHRLGVTPSVDDEGPMTSPPDAPEPPPSSDNGPGVTAAKPRPAGPRCQGATFLQLGKPTPSHFRPQPHCRWPQSSQSSTHHSRVTQDHTPSSAASSTRPKERATAVE
ncbi:hypothetical protein P7K49_032845, partial [Saguinus oedipus]